MAGYGVNVLELCGSLNEAELDALLDPERYTGDCAAIAREVSASIRKKRKG